MDILLLSTADWDHPFWTNKQHVAISLAKAGHRVVYLESLGLRQPTLAQRDRGRIFRRIRKFFLSPYLVRQNLWVVSPLLLPGIQKGISMSINRLILSGLLLYVHLRVGFRCRILWTYSPSTVMYFNPRGFSCSLYHCVDDISAQPQMPVLALQNLEVKTATLVDHIVVTTPALGEKLKGLCPSIYLMPNVVDYDHFAYPSNESIETASRLMNRIPGPIIGFVGAISEYKLDFNLLLDVVDARSEYSFVLIGKIGEGEDETDISDLQRRHNVYFMGAQSYKELPGFLTCFDVAILPSRRNTYTNSMFPMKFFEYLAAGLPVVAISIPALLPYQNVLSLCETKEEFVIAIDRALASLMQHEDVTKRQALASENTYKHRTEKMLMLIKNTIE